MPRSCPKCLTVKAWRYIRPFFVHTLSKANTETWTVNTKKVHPAYWECSYCHYTKELKYAS